MNSEFDNPESSSAKFLQTLQPLRDLESNWSVDLAKSLEDYLLKICSGEISGNEDSLSSVNFAEAALVLQGSAQVYGRKVEYLYSLVLHALEFISQKSQEDQSASTSTQKEETASHPAKDEEDYPFWGLDDIPVETKILLDSSVSRDLSPSLFVRPPANLVVLEGDCLDGVGDDGELEAYLLATNDLYRDFILLDYCDAVTVDNFLDCKSGKGLHNFYGGSYLTSKGRKSFQSPSRRSAGTGQKLSVGKKQDFNQSLCADHGFQSNDDQKGSTAYHFPGDDGIRDGYSGSEDLFDSDNDVDPWKHLDPHEPGNLIVKPYRKVKMNRRLGVGSRKHLSVATEFPLAKLHGPIGPELAEIWEAKFHASEMHGESQPSSLYEKLRQSLVIGDKKKDNSSYDPEDLNEDIGYDSGDPDSGPPDIGISDSVFNNKDFPSQQEKHDFGGHHFGMENEYDGADAHTSLEDLCRTHLDSLLASLSESEKQTELASRVSTWKQRIEKNLEEQDARPPFDIHKYGERILDKLSMEQDHSSTSSFGDIVGGQEKHDVARTFSALLQLVNNGDVDLVKCNTKGSSTCYSDVNSFHVRRLRNERKSGVKLQSSKRRAKTALTKRRAKIISEEEKENQVGKSGGVKCTPEGKKSGVKLQSSKRRAKTPLTKRRAKITSEEEKENQVGKSGGVKCTPEGKKRRKSGIMSMHFAG
ncbi:condensin-2 complex subunit H2-like [Primulina eburnea]|uniref:condensin-2 complex subunit H2-like n=1 Tax=Primulina eburnea TaxID=1245227 RepID=UPI003C6CBA87